MKKEQRQVYVKLANEINGSLCTFCKYADWYSEGCCEGVSECQHPIENLSYEYLKEESLPPDTDCYGFKPTLSITLASDITGVILAENFDLWFYRKYSRTSATVYGQVYYEGDVIDGKVRIG